MYLSTKSEDTLRREYQERIDRMDLLAVIIPPMTEALAGLTGKTFDIRSVKALAAAALAASPDCRPTAVGSKDWNGNTFYEVNVYGPGKTWNDRITVSSKYRNGKSHAEAIAEELKRYEGWEAIMNDTYKKRDTLTGRLEKANALINKLDAFSDLLA